MKNGHLGSLILSIVFIFGSADIHAQELLPLTDFSFFQSQGHSWSLAGAVKCSYSEGSVLTAVPGNGILINIADGQHKGENIISHNVYGDIDIEFDYLMPPGSGSGIFLQGRYKVVLRDSWGITTPTASDNAGIPGSMDHFGYPPRQNASRAPGIWQHIKISFQAPRFDADGKKTENAKILLVELNGITVQDYIELSAPATGAARSDEAALGPLRFQGDQGSVAFRNIRITPFDNPVPQWKNLKYELFKGAYEDERTEKKMQLVSSGSTEILSLNIARLPPVFLIHFTGSVIIKKTGVYTFTLYYSAGRGTLRIKDQDVISMRQGKSTGTGHMELHAGEYPVDIVYSKLVDYAKPAMGLIVGGPGFRSSSVSDPNIGADHVDPIFVDAPVNTILRSFSDIGSKKITHAVNVGTPLQVHYTYDMEHGSLVQIWRGDFLDLTTMWRGRGDGTARPRGMVLQFGEPSFAIEKLSSIDQAWMTDTAGSAFRQKGYILDDYGMPAFRYLIYQSVVNDKITILPEGRGFHRVITIDSPATNLYLKLAAATSIEILSKDLYLMDGEKYYLRMDDAENEKPFLRDVGEKKELLIFIHHSISYSILF